MVQDWLERYVVVMVQSKVVMVQDWLERYAVVMVQGCDGAGLVGEI